MDSTKSDMNKNTFKRSLSAEGLPTQDSKTEKKPKPNKTVEVHSLICNLYLHSQFQKQVYCFKRKEFFKTVNLHHHSSVNLQKLDFYALGFYFLQQNLMGLQIPFSFSNIIGICYQLTTQMLSNTVV